MGFFDLFFGEKKEEENKTQQIADERKKIREEMRQNLTKIGFTEEEIQEVFKIINLAEYNIDLAKKSLIGTNINNLDPTAIMDETTEKIRNLQQQMAIDIKAKIQEIQLNKQK